MVEVGLLVLSKKKKVGLLEVVEVGLLVLSKKKKVGLLEVMRSREGRG